MEFFDAREVMAECLWFSGDISERFRHRLPNNALLHWGPDGITLCKED